MVRTDDNPHARRWVDRTATQIHDPVQRLRFLQAVAPKPGSAWKSPKKVGLMGLFVLFVAGGTLSLQSVRADNRTSPALPRVHYANVRIEQPTRIWQVEKTEAYESYSNGLRIENRYSVSHRPRAYRVLATGRPQNTQEDTQVQTRSSPAANVLRTTESLQA